jgi:hypothetical protein
VPVHLLFLPVSKVGQLIPSQHPTIIKVPSVSTTPTPTSTSTAALGAPPANNSNPINADVLAFITDMVTCFKNAQVSLDKLPIVNIPTAIRICLDATCAQKLIADLQKVMTASGANIITIVGAIAAEGFAALGSLGALQWVGLAILHFAVYWWIMLQANITSRGVCIVHFLPYVSALSGGLVNGYAQGL